MTQAMTREQALKATLAGLRSKLPSQPSWIATATCHRIQATELELQRLYMDQGLSRTAAILKALRAA